MDWLVSTRIGRALAALGGLVVALVAAFALGRRAGGISARVDRLERQTATDRRMDHADVSLGDSDDDTRWLRDRSRR